MPTAKRLTICGLIATTGLLTLTACGNDPDPRTPALPSAVTGAGSAAIGGVAGALSGPVAGVLGSAGRSAQAGTSATTVPWAGMGAAGSLAAGSGAGAFAAGSGGAGAAGSSGAAGAALRAGAPAPSAEGFPKTDDVNVKAEGAYAVKTYSDGIDNPTYSSSTIYYPDGAAPPFAAVAFTPGFTATKEQYSFLGELLASHGIVALLTSPTSTADQPQPRADDLQAAVKQLIAENTRSGSPLEGKLDTTRICITGHSMGGGGTLWAANALGDSIRCAVPMQPWQPGGSFPKVTVPTLIIGAESDTIAAVAQNAGPHYQSIPASTEKILAVFKGQDHFFSTNALNANSGKNGPAYDSQAAYMISFYKLFLENDERYRPYLYGDKRDASVLSDYQHSKN
jgi:dienelactone hydrolase